MRSSTLAPVVLASLALGLASARAEEPAPSTAPASEQPAAAPAEKEATPAPSAEAQPAPAEQAPAASPADTASTQAQPSEEKGAPSPADAPAPSPAAVPEAPAAQAEQPAEPAKSEQPAAPVAAPAEQPSAAPSRAVTAAPAEAPPEEPPARVAETPAADPSTFANEVALQIGWNAPAGPGGYYLRRIDGTTWSVGAGLAPLTLWGPKVSLLVRHAERVDRGLFVQGSLGFSWGADEVKVPVVLENGSKQDAEFTFTPGRTLDLVAGYRWPLGTTFFELLGGYSLNIRGTALQTGDAKVRIDAGTRSTLESDAPGGVVVAASYGLLF